jgi:hypothetical protein
MSIPLVILMAILQFYVSIEQYFKGNVAVACMFFAYSAANVAYIWIVK